MSRDKKKPVQEEGKSAADYYKLNTQAVDDLATADVSNTPKYSREELNRYRSGGKVHIPEAAKLLFIKFWFPAAVCYFIFWGLSTMVTDRLDMLVLMGLTLGVVTDVLTNNAIRFFADTPGSNDRFMMIPKKGLASYPLNILYSCVVLFLVYTIYSVINMTAATLRGQPDSTFLGVEPVVFGVLYVLVDQLLIGAKHLMGSIVRDAKASAGRKAL